MDKPCERCGTLPPMIMTGPFAGSRGIHDYCMHCSEDLCPKCMETTRCRESSDGKHELDKLEQE